MIKTETDHTTRQNETLVKYSTNWRRHNVANATWHITQARYVLPKLFAGC